MRQKPRVDAGDFVNLLNRNAAAQRFKHSKEAQVVLLMQACANIMAALNRRTVQCIKPDFRAANSLKQRHLKARRD